ncbi:hypothetical protein N9112_02130 [bacterium]|nr:hypothetical protein [bacterium]
MAVRRYPWMDSMPQGARDGSEAISMDGWTDFCSCKICTSTILGGRIPQGAMEGGEMRVCYL